MDISDIFHRARLHLVDFSQPAPIMRWRQSNVLEHGAVFYYRCGDYAVASRFVKVDTIPCRRRSHFIANIVTLIKTMILQHPTKVLFLHGIDLLKPGILKINE